MQRRALSGLFTVISYSSVICTHAAVERLSRRWAETAGLLSHKTATFGSTIGVAAEDSIATHFADRAVRFTWVRGHSGHYLNEPAERSAVAIRRNYEAGVPTEARVEIADNIVSWARGMGVAS